MTDQSAVVSAARRLSEAETTGATCAPIRDLLPADDLDGAYRIQHLNTELGVRSGRRVVGRKIGLTNPAVQQQLGVDQPDFGTLFADMAFPSGATLPGSRLIQPRVEAEVALVLGTDLERKDNTIVDLIGAIDYVLAAIEIVDSRISDWDIHITDTIADNGSSGLFVVGDQPVPLTEIDVREVEMTMTINGDVVSEGNGAACLDNPLNAALWLANEVARRGLPLRAGEVVLTGALGPMRPLVPGDEVVADLSGLGRVGCRMAQGGSR